MNGVNWVGLISLALRVWVVVEALQVTMYGYAFTFRLARHDRNHPWLPALIGMSVVGATVAASYTGLLVLHLRYPSVDYLLEDLTSFFLGLGFRLKIVTIWRIDYGFDKWTRIRCAFAELCCIVLVTALLHLHYGF